MSKLWCLLFFVFFLGCVDDPKKTKISYMPDMADAPVVKLQRSYLPPPEGAVARNALLYPPEDAPDAWEEKLHNPFKGHRLQASYTKEGEFLYSTNCLPCHGLDGDGLKAPLSDKLPAPNIGDPFYLERKDGFFFHKITVGGPLMPSLRNNLDSQERWKVILHLRTLQEVSKSKL